MHKVDISVAMGDSVLFWQVAHGDLSLSIEGFRERTRKKFWMRT